MALVHHPSDLTTNAIIGAAIEVHRAIGPGVLESTYHKCLRHELTLRGVHFQSGVALPLEYKDIRLDQGYVIDLLVNEEVVVELKCVTKLIPIHDCQLMTYLRLRKLRAGLLINFKVPVLRDGLRRILL
jgi:GxxExxY protein